MSEIIGEKTFFAKKENLEDMLGFILSTLSPSQTQKDTPPLLRLKLAAEEALSNILQHGGLTPQEQITIQCTWNKKTKELSLKLIDQGQPFNPITYHTSPNKKNFRSDEASRDLGLKLINRLVDSIEYQYTHHKNHFTLHQKLN